MPREIAVIAPRPRAPRGRRSRPVVESAGGTPAATDAGDTRPHRTARVGHLSTKRKCENSASKRSVSADSRSPLAPAGHCSFWPRATSKIQNMHFDRLAIIYVRQSFAPASH